MDVRCGRNLAARELFGRGIARRSDADRLSVYDRQRFAAMRNRQGDVLDESEVDQDGFAGRAPLQDVLRLDVTMNEPLAPSTPPNCSTKARIFSMILFFA